MSATTTSTNASLAPPGGSDAAASTIQVLPQEVVDRIAAGEVVQRPSSALKELLENSLDAGSTKIVVSVDKIQGGSSTGKGNHKKLDFSISDNGCGIGKSDLLVAATRFATSKLKSIHDFSALVSFGFRGEALASISMVSHLTITSRTKTSPMAFECQYVDGKPAQGAAGAKRCARTPGTTVKVQDLFYNVPHRLKALQPKDEYPRMLAILQPYAVQVARRGVGIVCQQQQTRGKTQKMVIDLNTTNLPKVQALQNSSKTNAQPGISTEAQQAATKQVIATIYGSHFEQHLLYMTCQSKSSRPPNDDLLDDDDEEEEEDTTKPPTKMKYTCEGFLTLPSLASADVHLALKSSAFLLFVNDRYVECPPLKRQLEEVYASMTPWKKPPLIYLSIQVPPHHVDVNVHPTKTQVALLFLEDIVADITASVHAALANQGRSFGSAKQSSKLLIQNPYLKNKQSSDKGTLFRKEEHDNTMAAPKKRKCLVMEEEEEDKKEEETDEEEWKENDVKKMKIVSQNSTQKLIAPPPVSQKRPSSSSSRSSSTVSSKVAPPPSQLVRTAQATPVGSLEPFLVKQVSKHSIAPLSSQTPSTESSTPTLSQTPNTPGSHDPEATIVHQRPCPFASTSPASDVDLSQPGAFAQLSQKCTCRQSQTSSAIMLPKARIVRPAKVIPTECNLKSIRELRGRVQQRLEQNLQKKLRQAYFVSVVSHHQSLIQWQEELILINHASLAQTLFYQLALAKFDGNHTATLPGKLHVQTLIEQVLQIADDYQDGEPIAAGEEDGLSEVTETNKLLAQQATCCLWDNAAMLEDYFGIRFELPENCGVHHGKREAKHVVLTGLPILLDGHSPPPHGLPLFLLRLATEVNWEEERPCFEGVCRELGYYYAQLPSSNDANEESYKAYVQHTLFPALSYLLVPSKRLEEYATPLTLLSRLYKVFERC